MRTVAIINQKGGCGKTTSSINLAACLARLGQKTLLVDMDPQGHCGVGLAVPEDQIERTIYDTLIEPADGKPADISQIIWQIASDFDLAPSSIRLSAFEQVFAHRNGRDERLKLALDRVRFTYQWCIIDCPPSVGLLTFNALKACDQVIVPVETGYFSLHGLAKMMETLEVMRNKCSKEINVRILPTLYDTRTKLAREVLSELRAKFRHYLMESTVNFNTKLKEAASFGQPITEYDPGSRGYRDFVNLARELMGQTAVAAAAAPQAQMSRPEELVQRARQLSQFANMQFGKPAAAPAAKTVAPATTPAPATKPLPAAIPEPVINLSPPPIPAPAKTPAIAPIVPQIVKTQPAEVSLPVLPVIENFEMGQIVLPSQFTTDFSPQFRLDATEALASASEWPSEPELLIPSRPQWKPEPPLPSMTIGGNTGEGVRSPVPSQAKSTKRKIEEFYGVKQIGAEVIFAVHFDQAKSVLLAGDFNHWTPQSTPMSNGDRPGDWKRALPLPPGRYKYRLVVDGKWVTDPNNRHVEMNQFGELDNVIEVESRTSAIAA